MISKVTKSNDIHKILRMISREEQFKRFGGGQFVSMNKYYKNKKKYDRRQKKREFSKIIDDSRFYVVVL